ncbi:hypothetical protein PQX77_013132 [Marasmius sp. AFHP31]|nr:hypothetical protein PQX77_013132 [Marasmius sp. AFHP31]
MPKIAVDHRKSSDQRLVLFCDERATKRVIDARKCALRHFPSISSEHLVLQTDELDISLGERADITPDVWEIISETVSRFFAIERGTQITLTFRYKKSCEADPLAIQCTVSPTITLRELFDGFEKHLRSLDPPVYDGTDPLTYHYNGNTISASPSKLSDTPQDLKMLDGALIECSVRVKPSPTATAFTAPSLFASAGPSRGPFNTNTATSSAFGVPAPSPPSTTTTTSLFSTGRPSTEPTRFGKPVIYLFAREEMDVSVSISLIPQWSFSVLYPKVPIEDPRSASGGKSRFHQRVQWDVETKNDGTLREKSSGLDIAYLFWEADVNRDKTWDTPPSPTSEPDDTDTETDTVTKCFDPISCTIDPENSVVLSVETITRYLETALAALGLHTEARTSFITYWLPSFLKHTHIGFRFVSQASYELAAPMDITPTPDQVTRVFLLFKGVNLETDSDCAWDEAMNRALEDVRFWRDVVGVERHLANTALGVEIPRLRVLEWGGMEIV